MVFSEKLALLMKLSHTTNQELSQAVHLDASYISRLRTGKRKLPADPSFVQAMVSFFANKLKDEDAWSLLWKFICPDEPLTNDQNERFTMLMQWLFYTDENPEEVAFSVKKIFSQISRSPLRLPDFKARSQELNLSPYYYGIEGKREAVLVFFHLILQEKTPRTLYLFSEEDMRWMTDDPAYTAEWRRLFLGVLSRGNRIVIIHHLSRKMNEMFDAVSNWIPIYMTEQVSSFYYPKIRDDLFQETIFYAPKVAAILSRSIKHHGENNINFFVRDPRALQSVEEDFKYYLEGCLPLMASYNAKTTKPAEIFQRFKDFYDQAGGTMIVSPLPSFFTMPEDLSRKIAEQNAMPALFSLQKALKKNFIRQVQDDEVVEILSLPLAAYMKKENARVQLDFLHCQLEYSREDLINHMQEVLKYLQLYPNYRVYLDYHVNFRLRIQAKEQGQAMVIRTKAPSVIFDIRQTALSTAIWQELEQIERSISTDSREEMISRIRKYIRSL